VRIDVRSATIRFGRRTVFDGLDAQFADGHVTALIGPSGSGKSSLLAAMAGYQRLAGGTIVGIDADGREVTMGPSMVAWVPQGLNALGARTATENVMIGPLAEGADRASAHRRAVDALGAVGLSHLGTALARTLSGGELQRVSFARALAADKPVIFADEPSSSLDASNTARIAELLHALRARATIVVATHDPLLIEAAESHVYLREEPANAT
jgi:putative ABC transport system ATP-binding protein